MNDDISVVIPCFNGGSLVGEAVASSLSQRGGAPRVVVVDDRSTDPITLSTIEALPSNVLILRQENAGVASARNAGLRSIETPYAVVLDADDRLADGALSALRVPLDAQARLGFSFGRMRFIGDWSGRLTMPDYDPYALLFRHMIGVTALMRREMFEDVGGYDSALSGYEDWDFWLGALACGWQGRRVDAETVLYRRSGGSRHFQARANYRATYEQLRAKHVDLYGPDGRRRLAASSKLGVAQRLVYRFWWGPRPLPARAELLLQSLLWSARIRSRR